MPHGLKRLDNMARLLSPAMVFLRRARPRFLSSATLLYAAVRVTHTLGQVRTWSVHSLHIHCFGRPRRPRGHRTKHIYSKLSVSQASRGRARADAPLPIKSLFPPLPRQPRQAQVSKLTFPRISSNLLQG